VVDAISQTRGGLTVGHARLGVRGSAGGGPPMVGTADQQTHDGDTVVVAADGNLGVRLLGVDAAEISFTLPGGTAFVRITDPQWEAFLADPFAPALPQFQPELDPGLVADLRARTGPGTAASHARHAQQARTALVEAITADMSALGQDKTSFGFFLAFAHEVTDGYGRLLAYLNRNQPPPPHPPADPAPARPPSYNDRLLQAALVAPYFIWPNINPFRRQTAITDAVPPPGDAAALANTDPTLHAARTAIATARANHTGIYHPTDPLRLLPFELRLLARRQPPTRHIIDLSTPTDQILPPQHYHTIPNPEDRLFIPAEYIPLFREHGWTQPRH
jgi:hypothetical protein